MSGKHDFASQAENSEFPGGATTIRKLFQMKPGGALICYGNTKPVDGTAGFSPGCIFIHVDGTDGSALYVNEGTAASCDFNLITVAGA